MTAKGGSDTVCTAAFCLYVCLGSFQGLEVVLFQMLS